MSYDPTYPTADSPAASAPMRAQFQAIVDLINTIPVGPQGPQGEPGTPGVSVTGAVVDGTSTLNPSDSATASASFDGENVHFSFGISRGNEGMQGPPGNPGNDANRERRACKVQKAISARRDCRSRTSSSIAPAPSTHGSPRGCKRPSMVPGNDRPQGPQGPPGDVTSQQLADAIATAANTKPIATLEIPISNPPTQSKVQQVLAKVNELIVALRRPISLRTLQMPIKQGDFEGH